ncbi:hypothetical protein H8356DRAFT_1343541 [Neocallimastix lanati (nom. inval.)]|nr:hypothetical protein H8356DRAFT_1343541 [Neocallimastix sp. JGI-2020a]
MEENLIINKKILKYDSSHNHPKKEYDVSLSIMKHKIKNGIEKSSIPFGIKIKPLYNKISKEMRFICPEYNSIKSQISRNLNKKLPSNLTTFTEISNKSKYYKTKREYNDDIFVDGTFFIAPKFSYQIFITRTYAKELDTTSVSLFVIWGETPIAYTIPRIRFIQLSLLYCTGFNYLTIGQLNLTSPPPFGGLPRFSISSSILLSIPKAFSF